MNTAKALVAKESFKACPNCGHVWNSRNDFITINEISIVGYQPDFYNIEKGLFLFNHNYKNCGTTMAIRVEEFVDLYIKPKFDEPKIDTEECEQRCLNQNDIERCTINCKYTYVREIMQFFRIAL